MRKLLATVAVVCGIGLIVAPFALSLFDRAPAGDRVLDRFRTTLSVSGLQSLRTNFGTMGALLDQFTRETSPALARELHLSSAQWDAYLASDFPAITAAVKGLPPLIAFVSPVAAELEQLHPQFAAVDSLPFLGLPLRSIPWILLALGVVLIGLGVVVLRTPGLTPLLAAGALGVALVVVPLALSYPRKASDASKVASVGKAALSAQAVAGAQTANRLIDGMVTEVKTGLIPALAPRLHVSEPALSARIAQDYPAVARGLAAWPSIRPGALDLARRQAASVRDGSRFNLDFEALPWLVIGPGIALLLGAGAALPQARRRRPAASDLVAAGTPVNLTVAH